MSLSGDARDCLIDAIREHHNVGLDPEDLNTLKPSDPEIGSQDGSAWRRVLSSAAECLRIRERRVGEPTRERAAELLSKELVDSQLYLEELALAPTKTVRAAMAIGAATAAIGAVALVLHALARRKEK